jgi:hypothetical protein
MLNICTRQNVPIIELHHDILEEYIDSLIRSTSVIMAGSYPLRKFMGTTFKWNVDNVNIYGYTLEFLRSLLQWCVLNDIKFTFRLIRYKDMDLYLMQFESICIEYGHIGSADIEMNKDDQRVKTVDYILTHSYQEISATYYDGLTICSLISDDSDYSNDSDCS